MQNKNNEAQPFEAQSRFNDRRDSYVDDQGNYIYTKWIKVGKKWERKVVATIPFTEENRDIIILLDQDDHDCDLQERYDAENTDYGFQNQQRNASADSEDGFDTEPIENIPDPNADINKLLFAEKESVDSRVAETEKFMADKLTEDQRNLVYAHLGEGKYLEDIRREEETETGRKVTKQAVHNRWDRILTKACKHFNVEKPKQAHRKKDEQ